jgi:hypothetical protein
MGGRQSEPPLFFCEKTAPMPANISYFLRISLKLAVGIVLGLILSVIPVLPYVFLFLGLALLIACLIRMYYFGWRRDILTVLSTVVVIAICAVLPVKQLDVKVGPMAYPEISLSELCERLKADHGIICHVWSPSGKVSRLSFSTDQPLSRREVLLKLSKDAQRPLSILYCGTGATILFGGHPSFTYLGEPLSVKDENTSPP